MKKLLIGLVVLTFTFSLGTIVMSKKSGSRTLDFHKGGKSVKINFSLHKSKGVKCTQCHRKHNNGKRHFKKCGTCHTTRAKAMKIGHKLCKSCHKKNKGPTKCKGCHK